MEQLESCCSQGGGGRWRGDTITGGKWGQTIGQTGVASVYSIIKNRMGYSIKGAGHLVSYLGGKKLHPCLSPRSLKFQMNK